MRFSAAEYARGFITWESDTPISVSTSTASTTDEDMEWSAPLTDSLGSFVTSPSLEFVALRVNILGANPMPSYRVKWERVFNDRLSVLIWDSQSFPTPTKLIHMPNFGIFHRLVVSTPRLHWEHDSVVHGADLIVRFVNGVIYGERVRPLDQVEMVDGQPRISGDFSGTVEAHGRFIEIVAPGLSPDEAEQQAHTVLGYLALCLGEGAIGDVVFTEPHQVSADRHEGQYRIPFTAILPVSVQELHLDTVARALPVILNTAKIDRARRLALRWYERGLRASNPVDSLLGYFIGIEAILNSSARMNKPIPQYETVEKRFNEWTQGLAEPLDKEIESWLRAGAVRTVLADHFAFYVDEHGWEQELIGKFRELRRLRNAIAHGDIAVITEDQADAAKRLLRRLLATELGVTEGEPQSAFPNIRGITVGFEYVEGPHDDEDISD